MPSKVKICFSRFRERKKRGSSLHEWPKNALVRKHLVLYLLSKSGQTVGKKENKDLCDVGFSILFPHLICIDRPRQREREKKRKVASVYAEHETTIFSFFLSFFIPFSRAVSNWYEALRPKWAPCTKSVQMSPHLNALFVLILTHSLSFFLF